MNGFEFLMVFEQRCNYLASLEGIVLSRKIGRNLGALDGVGIGRIFSGFWMVGEILINILDDSLVLATASMGFSKHYDLFTFGIIVGKVTKMLVQYYLEGLIFRQHQDF
jgi:hypothetical protein